MESTKISSHQVFSLTVVFTCGTSILVASSDLARFSKQDAWIPGLLTIILGLPFICLYCFLGKLFPDKTLTQIITAVFGKTIGGIVSAFFVFLCLSSAPQLLSYVGVFMKTEYLVTTPVYVINAMILVTLVIALYYGLEVMARSAEILWKIVITGLIFLVAANFPNMKIENIFPVLENGMTPVFQATVFLTSFAVWPFILFNMIYPAHVNDPKTAQKSIILGFLCGSSIIFFINLASILVLGGNICAISIYPTYLLAKEINFGFFSRIEGIIIGIWIITIFFKIFLYLYAGLAGLSELLRLKDYKKIVLPLGLIVLVYSDIVYPNAAYQTKWDEQIWVPFIATFAVILPIALLIVSMLKKFYTK